MASCVVIWVVRHHATHSTKGSICVDGRMGLHSRVSVGGGMGAVTDVLAGDVSVLRYIYLMSSGMKPRSVALPSIPRSQFDE